MATFLAEIKGVGLKYVKLKDKDGEVTGAEPRCAVGLESLDADEHALADALAEMVGKRVKATIILEQGQLSSE